MDINELASKIASVADIKKIYVHGEKYSSSDYSLREVSFCIVTSSDPKETEKTIYRTVETDLPFNLLVYSEEMWNKYLEDKTSYAFSISKKGRLIYG